MDSFEKQEYGVERASLNDLQQKSSSKANRLLFGFSVFLALLFIVVILHLSSLQKALVKKSATETADTIATLVLQMRSLYSDNVVGRVKYHGVGVSHDYQKHKPAIPLPATFTFELGQRLKQSMHSKVAINLYSPYPFEWRAQDGGLNDNFRKDAWSSLSDKKTVKFVRVEEENGQQFLRLALADTMSKECVACHNSHVDSPKVGWKEGDVRGILEVKYSLNESNTESLLNDLSLILLLGGVAIIVFILFAVNRQKILTNALVAENQKAYETHKVLENQKHQLELSEQSQKTTTQLLEKSNAELQLQASEIELARLSSFNLLQDVMEEKDRAIQAGAAKGMFLATMSHEIRTPMNGIIGMAQLLANTELDEEQRKLIDVITSSGALLLSIINDILEFSKLDNHAIQLESLSFDLKNMMEEVYRLLDNKALEKGIELKLQISDDCPKQVLGDESRLKQVLINLVGNAIKFTESGSVEIKVTLLSISEKNSDGQKEARIEFRVNDTGIGISKDVQAHLFDAFTQADASTTRKYGGTGLGLAISQKIVQHMSSEIKVQSQEGKGSSFWFEKELLLDSDSGLTQGLVADSKPNESEAVQDESSSSETLSGHVLIVEDNPVNQVVLEAILEEFNLTFDIANNGQEAVDLYQKVGYAAILMDCQMPVMDGYTATKEIRKLETKIAKRTPIIAVTANALASDKEACYESGMDDFLSKPVMPETLFEKLVKWLSY